MPETITITKEAYKFSELDNHAKERARDRWREHQLDYDWWDTVYEDADNVAEIIGIELSRKRPNSPCIWFNGFYTQGSGSSFEGSYAYVKGAVKTVKEYAPKDEELHRIAANLQAIQRTFFYKLTAAISSSNREASISVEVYHEAYRWGVDGKAEEAITEALRDFNSWIFSRLEDEYDYLMSDEVVDELIEANGWLFEEDGSCL